MSNIERQDVTVQRFMWRDNGHTCGAGSLLSAITVLTETQKEGNFLGDSSVTNYLKDQGFVEDLGDNFFKPVSDKKDELIELGNRVSEAIGDEMEALPINTEIVLAPTIKIMPVPIPIEREN